MLDVAKTKFDATEDLTFQQVDAMEIPFEDGSMDVIACQFGVMFFPDKVQSYKEALRVLRPGGRYIFSAWNSHAHNPFAALGQAMIEELFPEDSPSFYHVPFHYHDADEIRSDLEQAGFTNISIEEKPISKQFTTVDAFARGFVLGNPLSEELRLRGVEPEDVVTDLAGAFRTNFGNNPSEMPLNAIFIEAQKA